MQQKVRLWSCLILFFILKQCLWDVKGMAVSGRARIKDDKALFFLYSVVEGGVER